jgi:hypothetical protein
MTNNTHRSSVAERACTRAEDLANRLEKGARDLAALADTLTNSQWRTRGPKDGRTIGVIVHHVASVYPLEIELAQKLAAGRPITGVTKKDVDAMNARHAKENAEVTKEEALRLLVRNSGVAAAAIRALSDEALANAAPVSLYGDAPLTCQFLLEDHAVRHSYHHLSLIAQTLQAAPISADE